MPVRAGAHVTPTRRAVGPPGPGGGGGGAPRCQVGDGSASEVHDRSRARLVVNTWLF
jgi:hypothetical protein